MSTNQSDDNYSRNMNKDILQEDEINLIDYWKIIWKRKIFITIIVVACVVATTIYSLLMPNIYQAQAIITPISESVGSSRGLSSFVQQFGALPGISLPSSASASEIVNLLQSNILKREIIKRYNLLPVFFHEQWDEKKAEWKKDKKGGINFSLNPMRWIQGVSNIALKKIKTKDKKAANDDEDDSPTIWDGIRALDGIIDVKNNTNNNTISISAEYHDPETATRIVEYFITALNEHMSNEARQVAEANKVYLEEQLKNTFDPLIKQKIYNLIAQQIEAVMMAGVKENFAFKIIDPPMVPDKKIKPKRSQMVKLSLVVSLFAGVFLVFFLEYIKKKKNNL